MRGGALLASLALVLDSVIFSDIIGYSVRYTLVYGSLASAIILMVWLYTCGVIIIMGCAVSSLSVRERESTGQSLTTTKEDDDDEEQSAD